MHVQDERDLVRRREAYAKRKLDPEFKEKQRLRQQLRRANLPEEALRIEKEKAKIYMQKKNAERAQIIQLANEIILQDRSASMELSRNAIHQKRWQERRKGVPEELLTPLPPLKKKGIKHEPHQNSASEHGAVSVPVHTTHVDPGGVPQAPGADDGRSHNAVWNRRAASARRICDEEGFEAESVRQVVVEINGVRITYYMEKT